MYITVGKWQPIKCSKCGSLKAVRPLNELAVEIRCLDCGHEKKAPQTTNPFGDTTGTSGILSSIPKIDENPTY